MNYRRIGKTGLSVSEVGYGAWGIGKRDWIGASDDESVKALHRAIDLGLNFIDTALVVTCKNKRYYRAKAVV
jgi:aryl-alcohol dehydrogenase-like predicted oxidoreductase